MLEQKQVEKQIFLSHSLKSSVAYRSPSTIQNVPMGHIRSLNLQQQGNLVLRKNNFVSEYSIIARGALQTDKSQGKDKAAISTEQTLKDFSSTVLC
jgi:hypothetical protein